MKQKPLPGLSFLATLINVAVLALIAAAGILLLFSERAQTRDALRLADMAKVRLGFELLYFEKNSFIEAASGCKEVGALVSTCTLATYVPDIAQIRDPGKFHYTISVVPDSDDYGVQFTLERRRGNLAAGTHTLTHAGVR